MYSQNDMRFYSSMVGVISNSDSPENIFDTEEIMACGVKTTVDLTDKAVQCHCLTQAAV